MLEHVLIFESSLVRISDVYCRSGKGGCGEIERETSPRVVLPRHGAFAYHFSQHEEVVADANTAIALHPQMEFKVSHPIDGGDCCTVFEFSDDTVLGALRGAVHSPITLTSTRFGSSTDIASEPPDVWYARKIGPRQPDTVRPKSANMDSSTATNDVGVQWLSP